MRAARLFALLNMAMHDAAVATWDTKFAYYNPRPSQLDPSIRTLLGLPNFPSYISGHSTFSAAAAEVLAYVHDIRETIQGVRMTCQPPFLRHFTAQFEPIG